MNLKTVVLVAPYRMMIPLVDPCYARVHELDHISKIGEFDLFLDAVFATRPAGKSREGLCDFDGGKRAQICLSHMFILHGTAGQRSATLMYRR